MEVIWVFQSTRCVRGVKCFSSAGQRPDNMTRLECGRHALGRRVSPLLFFIALLTLLQTCNTLGASPEAGEWARKQTNKQTNMWWMTSCPLVRLLCTFSPWVHLIAALTCVHSLWARAIKPNIQLSVEDESPEVESPSSLSAVPLSKPLRCLKQLCAWHWPLTSSIEGQEAESFCQSGWIHYHPHNGSVLSILYLQIVLVVLLGGHPHIRDLILFVL